MEVFPRVSLEAGRTLDDYYYAMTYEGITQEQLAIAVLCPHGEESEDEEEGQKEEPGQEGCDAGAKHQPSSSSRQHGDREGGNGPSQTHGTPEPRQPPATGHSSGKGAGVDVGTTAESRGGGEPHFSDSKGQIAPKYKDTGKHEHIILSKHMQVWLKLCLLRVYLPASVWLCRRAGTTAARHR